MRFKGTVKGADQTVKALEQLGGTVTGRVLRAALRKAAVKQIQNPARNDLRGRGYKNHTYGAVVTRTQRNPDSFTVRVAVSYLRRAFWLYFIEFGAARHSISPKNGRFLGFKGSSGDWASFGARVDDHPGVSPSPWLRPAFDRGKVKVIEMYGDEVWEEIRRTVRKQAAKQGNPSGR